MLPDLRERAREMRNLPAEPEKGLWAHLSRSQRRDSVLERRGFTTLRFGNHQVVRELEAVLETIFATASMPPQRWPHPNPSPEGEGP